MKELEINCADVNCEHFNSDHRKCILCKEAKDLYLLNIFSANLFGEERGWNIVRTYLNGLIKKYPSEEIGIITDQLVAMKRKRDQQNG